MGAMSKSSKSYVHALCDSNDGGGDHYLFSRITTLLDPHKSLSFCAFLLQASNERIPFFFLGGDPHNPTRDFTFVYAYIL